MTIYLDYAATTPVDQRVAEKMLQYLTVEGAFGNPSSKHVFGLAAKKAVENARAQVADLIHADISEIIWTSGATESNNLALKGAAELYKSKGRHIVTMKTEHPSILDCCQQLEKSGFTVSYLLPDSNGLLSLDQLQATLRTDTILVSIMHVNNEIGVIQDIQSIADLTSSRGILLHVDAAQSAGKSPLNLRSIPIDLISLASHKIYGPKGIGALYVRRKPRVRVAAQIHGGGHEQGMRSGTLATHQIVGMGEAFFLAKAEMHNDQEKILKLRNYFWQELKNSVDVSLNGDLPSSLPNIINVAFNNLTADDFMARLPELAVSAGSACLSADSGPSYVLRALGQTAEQAACGVRFSFGRFTTFEEIDAAVTHIIQVVKKLR